MPPANTPVFHFIPRPAESYSPRSRKNVQRLPLVPLYTGVWLL